MSARLPGPTLNPWLSLLTSIGMIAGPAAEAQTLVWELPGPPPPVVVVPRQPPPPVPTLRARAAEPAPAQQARTLTWEAVPPNPPPLQPPPPLPGIAETAIAARPKRALAWELVPFDDGSLAFTPPATQANPEAGVFGQLLARETTLRWYLVPEDQVLRPSVALANGTVRPEPPYLPEPPPPIWPKVRGLARGITVNGDPYPDTGLNVPNGFAQDKEFTVSTTLTGTSRTRSCRVAPGGNWVDCADSEAYLDITPFKGEYASLGFQYTIQSLTSRNRGTGQFAGQSIGFRTAINLTPTTGLAFGGEHIIQLDDTTDLGRNFYLVMSQAIPLSRGQNPILFVATAGIGSDFYGYAGNGTLGSTNCLSGNNVSSLNYPQGTDCFWGPIGALSLHLGSQVSIGYEWFGYGIGAGLSVRPSRTSPSPSPCTPRTSSATLPATWMGSAPPTPANPAITAD